MEEFDLNSSSKYEIIKRAKLNPALADEIIKARAVKPFASPADFDKRMAGTIPAGLRKKIVAEMSAESGGFNLAAIRERFIRSVDRYAELVLALPLSTRGQNTIPSAMTRLKLAARRLTADAQPFEDPKTVEVVDTLLDGLDFNLEALEEATHRALAGRLSGKSPYRRILGLPPTHPNWASIMLADDPGWELLMMELGASETIEIGEQPAGDPKSVIRTLLELGAKNKRAIAAMLKLLAKTLAPGWLDYIARFLEVANDIEMFDPRKIGQGEKGGATEDCFASVYLTGVRSSGGDVGQNWTLSFKVDGQQVSHALEFDKDYSKEPLLLRARYKIGICGQRNPVKVLFWATEADGYTNDDTLPGDVAFEIFDEPCPSKQEKELLTLIYEDSNTSNTSEELHATVMVFKDCGSDEIAGAGAI